MSEVIILLALKKMVSKILICGKTILEIILIKRLENTLVHYLKLTFKDYESKTIALIHVRKSTKRIYCGDLTNPKAQKFFVRTGAYTKALELEEAIEFINNRNLE